MKLDAYKISFFLVTIFGCFLFLSCDEEDNEDDEPDRTTHLVTFDNNSGVSGCGFVDVDVTFLVTYRDIQASIDLPAPGTGFLNVLVEDAESINIQVFNTNDDTPLANANVTVRTSSRPENLEGEPRTVTYCTAFNLIFSNF